MIEDYLPLVGTAIFGGAFFYYFSMVFYSLREYYWDMTDGVIKSSRVERHEDIDGDTYTSDVTYEYVVNNKSYNSSNLYSGRCLNKSAEEAEAESKHYSVGKNVTVYYNPLEYKQSVLVRGINTEKAVVLAFLLLVFVITLPATVSVIESKFVL